MSHTVDLKNLRMTHVRAGWRVRYSRPRRDGPVVHGTVVACVDGSPHCAVRWDGESGIAMVMIESLIASSKAAEGQTR